MKKKLFLVLIAALVVLAGCAKNPSMDGSVEKAVQLMEKKLPAGSKISVTGISGESEELSNSVYNGLYSALADSEKFTLADMGVDFSVSGDLKKVGKSNYYLMTINAVNTQSGSTKVKFRDYTAENGTKITFGDNFALNWRLYSIPSLILIGAFILIFYLSVLIGLLTKSNVVCLVVRFILFAVAGIIVYQFTMAKGWEYVLVVMIAFFSVNSILSKNQQKQT